MKYIALLLIPFCLFAQNGQPEQLQFNINGLPTKFSSDSAFFDKTDRFIIGWHWGWDRRF